MNTAALTRLTIATATETTVLYFRNDDDAHAWVKQRCPAAKLGGYGHYHTPEGAPSFVRATVCGARYAA